MDVLVVMVAFPAVAFVLTYATVVGLDWLVTRKDKQ